MSSQTLIPNLSGFMGVYCLKESLSLNFTSPSSTVMFLPGSFRKLLFSRTNGPTLQSRSARSWVFGTARWKYFSRVAKRCLGLVCLKPLSPVNWSESQYVASCGSSWIPIKTLRLRYAEISARLVTIVALPLGCL